jgi:hypothetical protein
VRAVALETLASANPHSAIPAGIDALTSPEPEVRATALAVLSRLDLGAHAPDLDELIDRWSGLARTDGDTAASIPPDGAPTEMLRDALVARARARGLVALTAVAVRAEDDGSMRLALDILAERETGQLANALETFEVAAPSTRPLLALWEPAGAPAATRGSDGVEAAAGDEDPFIRACADLVRSTREQGGQVSRSRGSMSPIELVLVLRGIPLFAELEPAELQRVAAIATERTYSDGEVIGSEGEMGEEMHVVVDGTVSIVRGAGTTIARRGPGDIVGEMAVITRAPRIASLIAEGDVRTLRIGYREFEGMVRERPEIALAVLRVLAERLGAASAEAAPNPA